MLSPLPARFRHIRTHRQYSDAALKAAGASGMFAQKISGAVTDRKALYEAIAALCAAPWPPLRLFQSSKGLGGRESYRQVTHRVNARSQPTVVATT